MKNKFKEISEHFDKQLEYVEDYLYTPTEELTPSESVSWGDHLLDKDGDLYVEIQVEFLDEDNEEMLNETYNIYYKDIKDIKDTSEVKILIG